MKRTGKILSLLLLGAALAVTGCSSSDTSTTASSAASQTGSAEAAADYKVSDLVKLGSYEGLQYTIVDTEVTAEEVDAELRTLVAQNPKVTEVKDRAVANGDTANIDYVGKLKGVAFDGGTASGFDLKIGSGSFIDGFEEGLIGHKPGEQVTLTLTFPENYRAEGQAGSELNGQETTFDVTINYIKETEDSELTDEFIQEYTESNTVDEYRKVVEEKLKASKEDEAKTAQLSDLINAAIAASTIEKVPDSIYNKYHDQFMTYYESLASYYSMELKDFLETQGSSEKELEESAKQYAINAGNQILIVQAIAEDAGITVTDEEYAEALEKYYKELGTNFNSKEAFEEAVTKDVVMQEILNDRVYEVLMQTAVGVEKEAG